MTYAYRVEPHTGSDGRRYLTLWRRRVLDEAGKYTELGEVERAVVPAGVSSSPEWQTTGGLLGRPCRINRERFDACGYSMKPPAEITP